MEQEIKQTGQNQEPLILLKSEYLVAMLILIYCLYVGLLFGLAHDHPRFHVATFQKMIGCLKYHEKLGMVKKSNGSLNQYQCKKYTILFPPFGPFCSSFLAVIILVFAKSWHLLLLTGHFHLHVPVQFDFQKKVTVLSGEMPLMHNDLNEVKLVKEGRSFSRTRRSGVE